MIETNVNEGSTWIAMTTGNLHVLRWTATPSLRDVQHVTHDVEMRHRVVKKPLVCMAIIPSSVEPPADEARKRMLEDLDRLLKVSSSVHFVIEGSGFKHVMLRSVVTGLILVAGRRGRIFVHSSLDEALRATGDAIATPMSAVMTAARSRGLVM